MKIAFATIFSYLTRWVCYPNKHKRQNKIIDEIAEGIPIKYFEGNHYVSLLAKPKINMIKISGS